jgi:hypothetical protein
LDLPIEPADRAAHDELSAYTLGHGDSSFIHQHVVDAFAAQHATPRSNAIGVAFALIGLYLHLERGYTGRAVQRTHMRLARKRRQWPTFDPPAERGALTVVDVMSSPPGPGAIGPSRRGARRYERHGTPAMAASRPCCVSSGNS